jgi:hypothetical protein
MEGPEEVVYNATERAIAQQQDSLTGLWSRVGVLLAAGAIASSFLGAESLSDGDLSCFGIAAIGCFLGVTGLTIVVLWPREWVFRLDARKVLDDFATDESPDMRGMFRKLAESTEDDADRNQDQLNRLLTFFQIASVLLMAEVVFWLIDLGVSD